MRVAVIAPPWLPVPPLSYGGTEAVVDGLVRGLHRGGHEVMLFAHRDSTCEVPRAYTLDRYVRSLMGNAVQELRHVVSAYERLDRYDVIHDHTTVGPFVGAALGYTNIVTTNHGPFDADLLPVYQSMPPDISVIAISHAQAATARDVDIARVIHHGIDAGSIAPGDGRGGYAAFLGRMSSQKGVHIAIDVARAAGVPLRIAAKMDEASERAYFEREIEPRLGGTIEYLGELSYRDKIELLRGAIALVNPIQWSEPFGMVMIEAMAAGTPVLSFRRGAAVEIVDHGVTGFLCDDEAEMAWCLSDAIGAIDRDDCRDLVRTCFSVERMVAEHLDVYRIAAERSLDALGASVVPSLTA